MKILAIGDFHGKFPSKLKKIASGVDLILSTGDYANSDKIRKIIFKYWTSKKWYDVVGSKKARELERESFNSGLKVIKELDKTNKTFSIWGNTDFYREYSTSEPEEIMPGFYEDKIKGLRNFKLIERKNKKLSNLDVVGFGKYLDVTEFIKNPIDKDKKKHAKRLKRYNKSIFDLQKVFSKKIEKGFIFLIHYPPYKIFDKVISKESPMNGKHVGFEPYNWIIKKNNPSLVICGHMHEHQGMKKYGNSLIVSTGSAKDGKAALIDFDDKNKKVLSVKFLK